MDGVKFITASNLEGGLKANYHTHTRRCKHASGEDREYVEAAIRAGIETLGFSDHCPWIFPDGYVSGIRMEPQEVEGYCRSLEELRREYAGEIRILIGFEAEYVPELMELQDHFLADYPIDYMILGQHHLGPEPSPGSFYLGSPLTDAGVLKEYVDTVIEGMETGRYLYLAHPDLIHYMGDDRIYEQEMRRLCEYLYEQEMPIEINMLGAIQGRNYPDRRFLQLASQVGNKCVIGVDAHFPEALENKEGEKLCREIINSYNLEFCSPFL